MGQYIFSAPIETDHVAGIYRLVEAAGLPATSIVVRKIDDEVRVFADNVAKSTVETVLASRQLDAEAFADKQQAHIVQLADLYAAKIADGFRTHLPNGSAVTFQIRPHDRANWLTARALYQDAVAAGRGETEGAQLRDADDMMHRVTFSQANKILADMAAYGAALMDVNWALKDAIKAASSTSELGTIDISAGWP